MNFFSTQNPGIGGLDELTPSEEVFVMNITSLPYQQGDIIYHNGTNLTVLHPGTSGQFLKTNGAASNPSWATVSGGGTNWDQPYGDKTISYDIDGNVETMIVGSTTLTCSYDIDGNVSTVTDGTNIKTFSYDAEGNVDTITYS